MNLRRFTAAEASRAADFLDSRTVALRWLVAYLRHLDLLPDKDPPRCLFFWGERESKGAVDLACILAHFVPTRTLYAGGEPDADLEAIQLLCEDALAPARVVGDLPILEAWRASSPSLFDHALRVSELDVFAFQGRGEVPAGYRVADPDDEEILIEYAELFSSETGEVEAPDIPSLIDAGLVHVLETGHRLKGMVLSNLSDGRYVHGGGVYVHPAYRGEGIGRLLAQGLGARVRDEEGATAVLDAYRENTRALAAYRAAGYELLGSGRAVWLDSGVWEGSGGEVSERRLP